MGKIEKLLIFVIQNNDMFEFDQYLGFILFLSVLTMGFWLLILLLTFIVPYWVGGALLEKINELRNKVKK